MPNRTIYLEDETTVIGDGAADDMAALRAIVQTSGSGSGRGEIVCKRGATYRLVSNASIPDKGLALRNVRFVLNGAALHYECDGDCYGTRMGSNAILEGPGLVKTIVSTNVFLAWPTSTWHAPISAGYAYKDPDRGVPGNLGALFTIRNWQVKGLTVENLRTTENSVVMGIIGDVADGLIEDIEFPDSAVMGGALGFDWSWAGLPDTTASIAAMRTSFDAGALYSVHPHNIEARRLKIGRFTRPKVNGAGGLGVRLSGCRDISIGDVEVAETTYAGFFNTAGDAGWEFAPDPEKMHAARGIKVSRFNVRKATTGWGCFVDWYGDNIAHAMANFGYQNILSPTYRTNIEIDSFSTFGPENATAEDGFYTHHMIGGTFRNIRVRGHKRGVSLANGTDQLRVQGGEVIFSQHDGITIGDNDRPEDCTVEGVWVFGNGMNHPVGNPSGIHDVNSHRTRIIRNITGIEGETRQLFGVRTNPATLNAQVIGNHCRAVKSGGAAVVIGGTDVPGTCAVYRDNTAAPGIITYAGSSVRPPPYIGA